MRKPLADWFAELPKKVLERSFFGLLGLITAMVLFVGGRVVKNGLWSWDSLKGDTWIQLSAIGVGVLVAVLIAMLLLGYASHRSVKSEAPKRIMVKDIPKPEHRPMSDKEMEALIDWSLACT